MNNKYIKFTKANPKDIIGSSFTGYLMVWYDQLEKCLGEPHDTTIEGPWKSRDGKTRVEWAFKCRGKEKTVITIYDYKESAPVKGLHIWHVGSMGEPEKIERFFKEKGMTDKAEPLSRGLLF